MSDIIFGDMMVDIETLGTRKNSVITQIGACFFDRNTGEVGEKFSINVQIQDCLNKGLMIDEGSLRFWFGQPEKTFLYEPLSLPKALGKFRSFYYLNKKALVWSHSTFDIPVLENAYNIIGEKTPFQFRNARDIRTLVDLSGIKYKKEEGKDPKTHDALDDCIYQVKYCCEAFSKLKEER
jgi:hypothetical protein